jgi:hypothetical protein
MFRNEKIFFMSKDQRIMFQMWKILQKKLGRGTVCGSDVVCTKESRQGTKPEGKFLDGTGTKIKNPPPVVFWDWRFLQQQLKVGLPLKIALFFLSSHFINL